MLIEPSLTVEEAEAYRVQAPEWVLRDEATRIERTYRFRSFGDAFAFVRGAGELAEAEFHHPDISFGWGYATVSLRTKKITALAVPALTLKKQVAARPRRRFARLRRRSLHHRRKPRQVGIRDGAAHAARAAPHRWRMKLTVPGAPTAPPISSCNGGELRGGRLAHRGLSGPRWRGAYTTPSTFHSWF